MIVDWEIVVRDLRLFAGDLLAPGFAPVRAANTSTFARANAGMGQVWLKAAEELTLRVPWLIDDLDPVERRRVAESFLSPRPHRGRLPKTATAYAVREDRVVPVLWEHDRRQEMPDPQALRWLLYVISNLKEKLQHHRERLKGWLTEASAARPGTADRWSVVERQQGESLLMTFAKAERLLEIATIRVQNVFGYRPPLLRSRPAPYPPSPNWSWLSRLNQLLQNPGFALPRLLQSLLTPPASIADWPFLYQRWCGLQLLNTCREEGWRIDGDVLGALFLGGRLNLAKGPVRATLWIEARIPPEATHDCNFQTSTLSTLSPDFLFQVKNTHDQKSDAFILDATLVTADEPATQKCEKYLHGLIGKDWSFACGVPIERRPVRAWLMAPSNAPHARVLSRNGKTGILPMSPGSSTSGPVAAWMRDIHTFALHQPATGGTPIRK